jgi:hypothetical protein
LHLIEENRELRLDCACTANRRKIDSRGKLAGGHRFVVFGPDPGQRSERDVARNWPSRIMPLKVAKQKPLVAWILPDQVQPNLSRQWSDLSVPFWVLAPFIPVEENGSKRKYRAPSLLLRNAPERQPDQIERVTSSGLKHIVIDVKVQSGFVGNLTQSCCVALFALPLAAQVDSRPLRNP